MTAPFAARAAVSRFSTWSGIVLFFALAIVGLFYVKWSPYYAKAFVAARDHMLGASIVSGNLAASPEVSLQAGLAYSIAYLKAIWQALLLGLALGAGVEVLLPRVRLSQFFAGSRGPLRALSRSYNNSALARQALPHCLSPCRLSACHRSRCWGGHYLYAQSSSSALEHLSSACSLQPQLQRWDFRSVSL